MNKQSNFHIRRFLLTLGMLGAMLTASVTLAFAQAVEPISGPAPAVSVAVVNESTGSQTAPHTSGDWVAYTDNSVYGVRFQNLDLGVATDRLIPKADGEFDSLPHIGGSSIVFTRARTGFMGIYMVQIDAFGNPGPATEVSPSTAVRRGVPAIGGDTIAFEEHNLDGGNLAPSEIALSSVENPTAPAYRLTNDTISDEWPDVSPDGSAVVWVKCAGADCDVWRAERTLDIWGEPEQVTGAAGIESLPDTNGPVTVYGSTASGDSDIHWSVKDSSGTYVESWLELPGIQRHPTITGNIIAFESTPAPNSPYDIWLYDLSTNRIYQLTNTSASESLADITTGTNGTLRVAWMEINPSYQFDTDIYALSAVLQPLDTDTAPSANPGGPYLGAVNTSIQFDGSLSSDTENNPLAYNWDFGDGMSGSGGSPAHTYTAAGLYNVCLTVNDGSLDSSQVCTLAVVYDPSAGFVTGGGWIDSPAGAYPADASLTGKASFGFVSKYQKGASVPTGNTAFQFEVAGLAFSSQSYEWLVVNQGGSNAQFKGSGLINGAADPNGQAYKFMLWATDGTSDTFRMRIWWEDATGEQAVYDNGAAQAIGGGNIVVHTKK